jgi:hypothetical protein
VNRRAPLLSCRYGGQSAAVERLLFSYRQYRQLRTASLDRRFIVAIANLYMHLYARVKMPIAQKCGGLHARCAGHCRAVLLRKNTPPQRGCRPIRFGLLNGSRPEGVLRVVCLLILRFLETYFLAVPIRLS